MSHDVKERKLAAGPVERAEFVKGLREMADWLEQCPAVPIPEENYHTLIVYSSNMKDDPIVSSPARLVRSMSGRVDKFHYSGYVDLTRRFSGRVAYKFTFDKGIVCEAKITGHVDVKGEVPVDEERAAQLQAELDALEKHEVVVETRPVFEYDCAPILKR